MVEEKICSEEEVKHTRGKRRKAEGEKRRRKMRESERLKEEKGEKEGEGDQMKIKQINWKGQKLRERTKNR